MSDDHHADQRDRKRFKRRYGPTITNPGLRIVMRDLAQKDQDAHRSAEEPATGVATAPATGAAHEPASSAAHSERSVRVQRRRRKQR
jgi:hypothetical protein